eukprot:scpid19621/ scgid25772/ Density-regulated protein
MESEGADELDTNTDANGAPDNASQSDENDDGESSGPVYPLVVSYCGVCSLPHELCEYSDDVEKCKEWMKANVPDIYATLQLVQGSSEAGSDPTAVADDGGTVEHTVSSVTSADGEDSSAGNGEAENGSSEHSTSASGVACAPTPGLKGILKKPRWETGDYTEKQSRRRVRWEQPNIVSVGTLPRGKKKTTVVTGLAAFGVDTKKASRLFAQKFATGVSTIEDQGLVLQGDVVDELIDLLKSKFKEVPSDVIRNVGAMKK